MDSGITCHIIDRYRCNISHIINGFRRNVSHIINLAVPTFSWSVWVKNHERLQLEWASCTAELLSGSLNLSITKEKGKKGRKKRNKDGKEELTKTRKKVKKMKERKKRKVKLRKWLRKKGFKLSLRLTINVSLILPPSPVLGVGRQLLVAVQCY
jgi:hypothetical protein